MSLRTCNRCGWVHMGVTRQHAEQSVAEFNTFFETQPPEVREMYGNKPSSITAYERCFHCGGPHTDTREPKAGDCPDGCTIQPIIVEELSSVLEVNS